MSNLKYVQKIDLSETFTKLVVKVTMSGQYKKSNYTRTEVLDMEYDLSEPVELYVVENSDGLIIDAYCYFHGENFIDTKIKLKGNQKPNNSNRINFDTLNNPIQTCDCECYVGNGNSYYWSSNGNVNGNCESFCFSLRGNYPCVPYDGYYDFNEDTVITYITDRLGDMFTSDVILPFFDNQKLGVRTISENGNTSLLTNRKMWSGGGEALTNFTSPVNGKINRIEMLIPEISRVFNLNNNKLSFNVEIFAVKNKKPITDFTINTKKLNIELKKPTKIIENLYTEGNEFVLPDGKNYVGFYHIDPALVFVEGRRKDGTNQNRLVSIKFTPVIETVKSKKYLEVPQSRTFYTSLDTKDIEKGVAVFDLSREIPNISEYTVFSNDVFIVKNDENYKISLCDILDDDVRELPYNVSRVVYGDKILQSKPIYKNGVEKYPLSWIKDVTTNELFNNCKTCLSFTFYSPEHQSNFDEILKQNQIANLEEEFNVDSNGNVSYVPRFFTGINQWFERSTLNIFDDISVTFDVDGKVEEFKLCPSKETLIQNYSGVFNEKIKTCNCLYSDSSSSYIYTVDVNCEIGDCSKCCTTYQQTYSIEECWSCESDYFTPISTLNTDLLSTTYASFREVYPSGTVYSGYTNTGTSSEQTFDIHIELSGFTGGTVIPISSIDTLKHRPLTISKDPKYVPYYSYKVFSGNGGNLVIDVTSSNDYMSYEINESGTYRFQYNAYLDVEYQDTRWADYVLTNYLTGNTSSIGYPSTDYQVQRLINSSVIRAGYDEGETVKLDTNSKYFPGKNGFSPNSGITKFDFEIYIERTAVDSFVSNLSSFTVSNDPIVGDSSADSFLVFTPNIVQNVFSGFSNSFGSGATGNTVFRKSIPISLDSGLVELTKGDVVKLKYQGEWSTTSKNGGTTNLILNLGHELDFSGNPSFRPSYRVVKFDGISTNKKLFLNPQSKSKSEKYIDVDGNLVEKSSQGSLYTIDDDYKPIVEPTVNDDTFNGLTFIDNNESDVTLELSVNSDTPRNLWSKQLLNGSLRDYYLLSKSILDVVGGKIRFNLPRYDQKYSLTCDYKFPQINHSYVVLTKLLDSENRISNIYTVFTPKDSLYVPCYTPPIDEKFKLVQSQTKSASTIDLIDNTIEIGCNRVTIKKSGTSPITSIKSPNGFKCQYYCVCKDNKINGVDPYFGTTTVITDNNTFDCDGCRNLGENYCKTLSDTCSVRVFTESCEPQSVINPTQESFYNWTCYGEKNICQECTPEFLRTFPGVNCPYTSCDECRQKTVNTSQPCNCGTSVGYTCSNGDCIRDNNGVYTSLQECENACKSLKLFYGYSSPIFNI